MVEEIPPIYISVFNITYDCTWRYLKLNKVLKGQNQYLAQTISTQHRTRPHGVYLRIYSTSNHVSIQEA